MAFNVFISDRVCDLAVVYQFKQWLEINGIGVYVDSMQPQYGSPLPLKISQAIAQSDCVIAILTHNGTRSDWVNQEIGYASHAAKPIIPVVEAGVKLKGFIAEVDHVTFQVTNLEPAISNVINYVGKLKTSKEKKDKLQAGLIALLGLIAVVALSQK